MANPEDEDAATNEDCRRRVLAGDGQAGRELVERTYPLVAKIVRAYLPRGVPYEDYEQEVFLRMFSRLQQYRGDAPLEHWLSRLAIGVCIDGLRRRGRRKELRWSDLSEREIELLGAVADPSSVIAVSEAIAAREFVDKLLACLDAEDQVIIRMLDLEGRSTAEISVLLGRSQTSIKVRAFRARRKLRKILESRQR